MYCSSSDYDDSSSFQSVSPKRNLDSPSNVSNFTVSARNCRDNIPNHNNDYDEEPRRKRPENEKPNHILLFTIINPSYPITTDVLKQICQGSGNVVRIVVFKKNGVQAMIEFETLEDAKNAKETLNGADIYSGCCTLKIEYAKPTKLNVYKNDSESWDYTQPALGRTKDGPPSRPGPLLPEPPRHMGPNNSGPPSMPPNYRESLSPSYALVSLSSYSSGGGYPDDDYFGAPAPFEFERSYNNPVLDKFIGKRGMQGGGPPSSPHGFRRPPLVANNPPMTPTGSGAPGGSCVLMVYELDAARVNPDKVFNLFCLYGNVAKIKFLKTKEGCCMVQMGDALSADRVIANLSKTMLSNGKRLAVAYSKQVYLSEVSHPYDLPDGSESFKDFTGSRKNRYMNPKMAMKNRIQAPSQILHFFNAPPDITVEQLADVFKKADITPAKAINIFPNRNTEDDNGKPASSSSGLIEFDELNDAVDAIMHCNHVPIQSESGKYPFMLKLCFSSSRSVNSSSRNRNRDYEEEVD